MIDSRINRKPPRSRWARDGLGGYQDAPKARPANSEQSWRRSAANGVVWLALLVFVLLSARAQAQSYPDNPWIGERVRAAHHVRHGRASAVRHKAVAMSDTRAPACRPSRRVIGEEGKSRPEAVSLAKRRWLNEVRHDWGSRYGNIDRAKGPRGKGPAEMHCNPSTITRWISKVLWTCVIEGQPCRATEGELLKGREFTEDDVDVRDLEKAGMK